MSSSTVMLRLHKLDIMITRIFILCTLVSPIHIFADFIIEMSYINQYVLNKAAKIISVFGDVSEGGDVVRVCQW